MQNSHLGTAVMTVALAAGLTASAPSHARADFGARYAVHSPVPVLPLPSVREPTAAPSLQSSARTVTLITGDRVSVDSLPDGQQAVNPLPPRPARSRALPSGFVQFTWDGDHYAVPDSALPYLSSALDPRLFDVSYLVRAGLDDARSPTIPVTVAYHASAPGLKGLRVVRTAAHTATAVIIKSQATALGSRFAAVLPSARLRGTAGGGQPARITRITLAPGLGAPPLPAAPGDHLAAAAKASGQRQVTLTLRFIGLHGSTSVTALGVVQNVSDPRLGQLGLSTVLSPDGQPARLSVPTGSYSLEFDVLNRLPDGNFADAALVVKPQVSITSTETITLDARAAKPYQVGLNPPVTGMVREDILGFSRLDATGGGLRVDRLLSLDFGLVSYPGDGNMPLLATPTTPVTQGSFGWDALTSLTPNGEDESAPPSAKPSYLLSFPHAGTIPALLSYTIPRADLTTLHQSLYDSPSGSCSSPRQPLTTIYQPWGTSEEAGLTAPAGNRTDYWYSSAPRLEVWQAAFNADDCSRRWDIPRRIRHGEQITETWNKAPLVPASAALPQVQLGAFDLVPPNPLATMCEACRQDNNALLYLQPFGDSDLSHFSEGVAFADQPPTSALTFSRNGKLAFTSASWVAGANQVSPYALDLPLLPGAASYRLDWTQTPSGDPAASNQTDWIFGSSSGAPAAKLPGTETCAPDPVRPCSFLPLLFIRYDLPLNLHSQAQAGQRLRLRFTVTHQQHEPAPAGLGATVSESYNGGQTWTPARAAALRGGWFSVTVSQPPLSQTDGFVALRVRAHDGAGSSVIQTIIRAYALSG